MTPLTLQEYLQLIRDAVRRHDDVEVERLIHGYRVCDIKTCAPTGKLGGNQARRK
jgi:hypothetical protein